MAISKKLTITSAQVPSEPKVSGWQKPEPFVPVPLKPAELNQRRTKTMTKEGVHIGPWTPESGIDEDA
jgi:hypothetical protein